MKIAILFGSSSNEHDVSIVSASSVIKNLDHQKYIITPIYIDQENNFYEWTEDIEKIEILSIGNIPKPLKKITNIFNYLKKFNLVFIMIHGKNGEDGTLSTIFDFLNIKYLANKPAASIITMDKIFSKIILEENGIKTSPYLYFTKYNNEYLFKDKSLTFEEVIETINSKLTLPLFVKPAGSGSSIGVTKVTIKDQLKEALKIALEIDNRILIEEGIDGREIECGLLEQDGLIKASAIGEVKSAEDFYSFSAKYTNESSLTEIPAQIPAQKTKEIQDLAIKIFKILNCHGYSRCDFFLKKDGTIIFNEINTIPGFTEISMYPKLFEASNIQYKDLLDILITNALKGK